ncbi:thiamine diphosphokinase [Halobacillus sp. Marseille-Q1614]|uniref:thiamine diphosphokinase n=1 Tax=Halobacillus sp. Marseille-Q1614 TaxID=2709134 RepID=UPI00156FFED2|nr:thiamine diphosphokinase [Halobacillus sp. Marseille-Q1614]
MSGICAIVGGSPKNYIPRLAEYHEDSVYWIGADQGAEFIVENGLPLDAAIGDFDSVTNEAMKEIKKKARTLETYPAEKDETDLELAIQHALKRNPEEIILFGVTGGRFDHTLINIQMLHPLYEKNVKAKVIDHQNQVELFAEGEHTMKKDENYPYVSFIPVTLEVTDINLRGFYYPLVDKRLTYGSTLCISNHLIEDQGTFSFTSGILLVIRSKDSI